MSTDELTQYLHQHIPMSQHMGVRVRAAAPDAVTLAAPLAPNINHRETVFGGSASAVALLAAWTLLYVRLRAESINARVVVQYNTIDYDRPITGDFTATAALADAAAWRKFLEMLRRRGRARIAVGVALYCNGEKVGALAGDFVALASGT
ncbi:MAG: YiiD C-terminal domain-containing protein [Sulfurifustis sp.]